MELSRYALSPLREGDFTLYRGSGSGLAPILVVAADESSLGCVERLEHEYALNGELEADWAARPVALTHSNGSMALVLEDPGGVPVDRLLGRPLEISHFLRIAIPLAGVLRQVHARGLIHKDIKPANILADAKSGGVWLTGFGIASRLPRERQAPTPPEVIAGTLAYMAPEQTGRMNRSVDSRSDLYALGVTFYEMLTGTLPFTATDPMEWVHCHVARRPVPPGERRKDLPRAISAIVMKLIAKTPEERYQTAAGLESDLRLCLAGWEAQRRIDDFPLGEHDRPNRLLIPEKLYGREREVETLLAAFDRIVNHATPELVLVSGHSGIGKTSVVNELHKALVPPRGLFASGKFDQYKRDIPYATLVQAFQSLVRPLLSKSEAELTSWRHALLEALGPNGRLMTDLIPELTLIIGDQPPAPELPPQQAQSRFQLMFQRFIGVFAQPEHPLALFLDDLQWLDAATLDLLDDLLTRSDLQHLMLIGAYRDNEVSATHPLMRKLDAIKAASGKIAEITLAPLAREHLGQLIADALRCETKHVVPLAELAHEKTGGNPFFAMQFLSSLAEESLITFDHDAACWSWDLDRIHTKGYTDNVVDLMAGKLIRLSADAQHALQQLACLGNIAEIATLSVVLGIAEEQVDTALWPARRQELVERMAGTYRFVHDRVQEAAYSMIPKELRIEAHLRIGRLLAAHTSPEKREETIFDIVNQLNRGASLITSMAEREQLAELNLLAGQRAKASTAYVSALSYLTTGLALLPKDGWHRRRELAFALELNRAECEFLTGALAEAEQRLEALSARTTDAVERATVARLRVELYVALDRSDCAVAVGLEFLRPLGIEWSPHPTAEEARCEYQRIWSTLGDRPIEDVVASPTMTDPGWRATMDVLTAVVSPALFTDENLVCLVICRMANLSLEHGISDAGCFAYVWLGNLIGPHFGAYREGFRFGKLGLDLTEQRGLRRFEARVYLVFGGRVIPWTQPIRAGQSLLRRAFVSANQLGDLTFAGYSCDNLIAHLLATGDGLGDVQREAENGLEFAQKARFGLVVDIIKTQLQLIRTLRGLTPTFGSFDEEAFDERLFERHLASNRALALAEVWYWIRKMQARFFSGDYASAIAAAANAEPLLFTTPFFDLAEYHLYAALARAALCDAAGAAERVQHLEALATHHRQLQAWSENCPENFENRAALVGAEIARIEDRTLDAMNLYEQAIRSAQVNGFVHNEAVASELAARFYAARGFEFAGRGYLRNARHCYLRWGADGKVRQLDMIHPRLRKEEPAPASTSTITAPVEHLDLATVIKVSQALSGEIVLEKLLDTLMRTAMAQAGAERVLLILPRGAAQRIAAKATTSGDTVTVDLRDEAVAETVLPESVLHYVLRTRESVILDDAATQSPFAADPYIRQRQARSVLCLPLLNQAKLIGVLYLENNLAPRVFAPVRLAVLKLLASQAAISLENTRLYRDLAEREAKIRRLVEANIIGIFIFDFEDRIVEANDAFLQMVGYDREDLVAGRIRWTDLTPPEWRGRYTRASTELKSTGTVQPYEREYFRKDGSRVPALIGSAAFDEQRDQGVAFVLDLTERKRAEESLHKMQTELAHANRVATTGQLTASIAHEVNQPITGAVLNAEAALRWLGAQPPNLEQVRRALGLIVEDGTRAGNVIGGIRALIKKAPPQQACLDLNEAIREVIALTRGEAAKTGVSVRTDLADGLPLIYGDRVQLQQVILNLIINAIEAMGGIAETYRTLLICTQKAEPNGVLVEVRDSGPGFAPATVERLFEAFHTTKPGGLGLGLSICRSTIEAHGGRLCAKANVPRGAIFEFSLPAQKLPTNQSSLA
jgi:PAS domain S-box-containing protein